MTNAKFLPEFKSALKKYSNAKKAVEEKINLLLQNPLGYGEPLKYNLTGLSSCSVKKNFILIYIYCRECRIKGYQQINGCGDCSSTPDETIKFLTFGPHDSAYNLAKKLRPFPE